MKLLCRSLDSTHSRSLPTFPLAPPPPLSSPIAILHLAALLGLLSTTAMNQLTSFGVNYGLPNTEFVQHLTVHSATQLISLRQGLFDDACKVNLVPPELRGLPLVGRRDSAIRPASKVLGEDIWSIVTCITNKTTIPRTLLKNGKRSREFLIEAPAHFLHKPVPQLLHMNIHNIQSYPVTISSPKVTPCQTVHLIPIPINYRQAQDSQTR